MGASRRWSAALSAAILIGTLARASVVVWSDPWGPHHPDEHILPLEALGLWEGVTPREVGWPGSTTRILLSGIEAAELFVEKGFEIWQFRQQPDRALHVVTTWIGTQFVEPASLYKTGRMVSIVTGVLQLLALAWALRRWTGPVGIAVGTLAMAISPVAVAHSQYVLADVTGLLFATIALGLAADPTPRRVIVIAALVGLAAASKFHFGLWLLTPLLCVWFGDRAVFPRKWILSLAIVITAAWVGVTLVPWFLINPLLGLKEFAGVVLVKVGHGSPLGRMPRNAAMVLGGLGALAWIGALAAGGVRGTHERRRIMPIAVPLVVGMTALVLMATVFDRYGLVLMPGAAILAGLGWDAWLQHNRAMVRRGAAVALAVCIAATITSLVYSQRVIAEIDVDALVKNWVVANVKPGARVAVHDEMNALLPRAADQLRECANRVTTVAAYEEKWLTEGVKTSVAEERPMEAMVMTDERFSAYWCRRELGNGKPSGFRVVSYHAEPRFEAVLEHDAVNEFRTGSRQLTGGVDVLVMNRPVDVGLPPIQVFRTARGQRVIYKR